MAEADLWVRTSTDAEAIGPLTASQVRQMARTGLLTSRASVRRGIDGVWHPAAGVKGLLPRQAPRQTAASITGSAVRRKPNQETAGPIEGRGDTPSASTETPAAQTAIGNERTAPAMRNMHKLLALILLAVLGASGYFAFHHLSPYSWATARVRAAHSAMMDYHTEMQARNVDAAAEALRSYLDHAELLFSADFDRRLEELPLDKRWALEVVRSWELVHIRALGTRIGDDFPNRDIESSVNFWRRRLKCVNMTGASEREYELMEKSGMWALPDDIAARATDLANRCSAANSRVWRGASPEGSPPFDKFGR